MNNQKVAIITGAAGGIGRATALRFAQNGYALALCDLNADALDALSDVLGKKYKTQCLNLAGDLSDVVYLESIVPETIGKWGRIDVLINNAAWRTLESMRTMEMGIWEKTLKICLTAPAFLTKWAAAAMEEKHTGGVIVNVTSMMSERPSGAGSAYIAAKGALESLVKESAVTYGRSGIRVVGIAPGYIDTDLSNDYIDQEGRNISKQLVNEVTDAIPLGRGGKPEEVADAILWVSSESASYVTGTTLVVDGGFKPNFSKYSIKKLQFPEEF
jgi:NAD(P)-dependent dehydrogenase (short-subunit alcohol dehydrogenase family)